MKYFWILLLFIFACTNENGDTFQGSGTIEATEVTLSSQNGGKLLALYADEGDYINEGDVIAVIDSEKIALQIELQRAMLNELEFNEEKAKKTIALAAEQFELASKNFNRIKNLIKENSATKQRYDESEIAYKGAEKNMQIAESSYKALLARKEQLQTQMTLLQTQLQDCLVITPLTGTVLSRYVQSGEVLRPFTPIMTVANLDEMEIRIYVPEKELGNFRIGDTVKIKTSTSEDNPLTGRIVWVASRAEFTPKNVQTRDARADLVYAVKCKVANRDGILKIGMPADVYINGIKN